MKAHNLKLVERDTGYRWATEPEHTLLYRVRIVINNASMSSERLAEHVLRETGQTINKRTVTALMDGKPKQPQLRTVDLIMRSLGYKLSYVKA